MPKIPSPDKPAGAPMIPAGKVSGLSSSNSSPAPIKSNLVDNTAKKISLNLNIEG